MSYLAYTPVGPRPGCPNPPTLVVGFILQFTQTPTATPAVPPLALTRAATLMLPFAVLNGVQGQVAVLGPNGPPNYGCPVTFTFPLLWYGPPVPACPQAVPPIVDYSFVVPAGPAFAANLALALAPGGDLNDALSAGLTDYLNGVAVEVAVLTPPVCAAPSASPASAPSCGG